jgi:two-component system OmpR family response regulator
MRILIVEDDRMLADGLIGSLRHSGYTVDWAENGAAADAALASENFDLLILDLGLPDMDGFDVVRKLRARKQPVPVMILTARDALDDRVRGLDLGADDYLIKPVALPELEARIRALIRRGQCGTSPQVVYGPLVLDTVARRAWANEAPLDLTARELEVLEYFLSRTGRILSKEQILQALCGWGQEITLNAVEAYVHRLRVKLEPTGVQIRTVRGLGYLLEKPDEPAA